MSAPPKDHERLRATWASWLEVIKTELFRAHNHQQIWSEVRDAHGERWREADASFIVSYSRVYAESQAMTVRRLAEDKDDVVSLGRLLRSMSANRAALTKEVHSEYWASCGVDEGDRLWRYQMGLNAFTEFDDGTGTLSAVRVEEQRTKLAAEAAAVERWATKTVAHLDGAVLHPEKVKALSVTFQQLRQSLSAVAEIANFCGLLLGGGVMNEWTPWLQGDWQQPLRASLFPCLPEWYVNATWTYTETFT